MPNYTVHPVHDQVWERVIHIFEEWTERLQMNWLHLTLSRSDSTRDEDENCAADTETQWEYRFARIRVFLPAVSNHTDEELETVIVHELVHVLVASMECLTKEKDTKQVEYAVENVSRALIAAKRPWPERTILKAA